MRAAAARTRAGRRLRRAGWRTAPSPTLLATLAGVAALTAGAHAARADVYRCVHPDGRIVYTDSAAACPGATPHEVPDVIQTAPTTRAPRPAAPSAAPQPREVNQQLEASQESVWRGKRRRAEEELRKLDEQAARYEKYVGWCNRGHEVIARDEAGLRRQVSCRSVRERLASLESRREELRAYLAEGIHDECRRAGCLPGWLR